MVGTLDFQVKTLVFETCTLLSLCLSSPPPQEYEWVPANCQRRLTKYWLGGLGGLGRGGSDNMPP